MKKGFLVITSFLFFAGISLSQEGVSKSDQAKLDQINAMFSDSQKSFPKVPNLTVNDVLKLQLEEDSVFLDVRTSEEREVSIIPGAISKEDFKKNKSKYKKKKIIAYCTLGSRSGLFVKKLRKKGFDAYNLKGSILAWAYAGQPLIDQNGPTKRVHVYRSKWNLLPDGYEAVWDDPWWSIFPIHKGLDEKAVKIKPALGTEKIDAD